MSSPSPKRIKLEAPSSPSLGPLNPEPRDDPNIDSIEDSNIEQCSICLQHMADRTLIPTCSHEFCFECLLVWTDQSRRCPLCSQGIGDYLIHHIRSKYDFQKHYLPPLRTSPKARPALASVGGSRGRHTTARRSVDWGRNPRRERQRERDAADALERAIDKRKWVYRHGLYAKHVASNFYTRYRPFPTPSQFATNPDLITRATIFVRRELQVWGCLDVEFLTTFTVSLLKSLDIRSESAIKLLSEFLDLDSEHELQVLNGNHRPRANAEHFAHELYCYLRSPYRDLAVYDTVVQYDTPEEYSPPRQSSRRRRWQSRSASSSRQQPPSRSQSRSLQRIQPRSNQDSDRYGTSRQKLARRGRTPRSRSVSPKDKRPRNHSPRPHFPGQVTERGRDTEAGEETISRDIKGKGRAVDNPDAFQSSDHRRNVEEDDGVEPREIGASNVVQASASENEQETLGNESSYNASDAKGVTISPHSPLASTSRRRRTVFDQLQSHLSKASDSKDAVCPTGQHHEKATSKERPRSNLDKRFHYPVATKPALLDRLSGSLAPTNSHESGGSQDTSHDPDVDRVSTPDHVDLHNNRSSTTPTLDKVTHTNKYASRTTRDTMLQWLNEANRSGKENIQQKRSSGIDDVSATVKSLTSDSPSSSHSTTSASTRQKSSDKTQPPTSALRAKLLTKLENERRIQDNTACAAQVTVNGATPPHSGSEIHSSNSTSSQSDGELEAKLRSQALLRAKLAVERKNALVNLANQPNHADQQSGGSPLELSERELKLKIQLRKGRG